MAQLNDTMVQGDLRVTGKVYGYQNAMVIANANNAVPPVGVEDNISSAADYSIGSGAGKNLPTTDLDYNIHTVVTHFTGTTYRVTQIATGTGSAKPTVMYERSGISSDGITWSDWSSWKSISTAGHTHAAGDITSGTLSVARGGTGISTSTNVNAVVIGNSTTATNEMQTVRTGNGAFYATAQDAKPTFGTLPIAQGGTGATTRLNALKKLTDESVGTNATYFLTITNSWGKGGYTSVAEAKTVLGLGSAAYTASTDYAPSSTISCTTANVKTALGTGSGTAKYLREDGTWQTPVDSKVRITVDSSATTYKILATAASSPTTNTDSQAKYSASCTITGDGTMGAVTYNVNSKCTLQFDSTNDALDFVFA